jgi:hypothetical protein
MNKEDKENTAKSEQSKPQHQQQQHHNNNNNKLSNNNPFSGLSTRTFFLSFF